MCRCGWCGSEDRILTKDEMDKRIELIKSIRNTDRMNKMNVYVSNISNINIK